MGSFSASAQINEVMRQVKEKLQARSSSVMQMFHSMDKVRRRARGAVAQLVAIGKSETCRTASPRVASPIRPVAL